MVFNHDPVTKAIWAYSEDAIFEVIVKDESRDVWRLLLQNNQFTAALEYCKDEPEKRDKVYRAQAEHYFSIRSFELAAEFFWKNQSIIRRSSVTISQHK